MPLCKQCGFGYTDGESHNCKARRPPTEAERAMLRRNFWLLCLFAGFMSLARVSSVGVLGVILEFLLNPLLLVGGGYIAFRLRKGYRDPSWSPPTS